MTHVKVYGREAEQNVIDVSDTFPQHVPKYVIDHVRVGRLLECQRAQVTRDGSK